MKIAAPSPKQRKFVTGSTRRINIAHGSVRSGKTIASLVRWVDFIRHAPPGNLAMVGKTERTLKRNVLDPLVDLIGARHCRVVVGSGEAWILGRRVYLVGANDERSITKIQGLTLLGAYGDELCTWRESFFAMLLSRLSEHGAKFFGTTNPDSPAHWLKRQYLDRAKTLDLYAERFRLDDNTSLDPAYVAALQREYTGLWHRRYILGEWVAAEGAIYDILDLTAGGPHVTSQIPDIARWWVGIDYGTANPFVALLIGEATDHLVVAREWRWDSAVQRRQLTDAQYSERIADWLDHGAAGIGGPDERIDVDRTFIDPSAASFIRQTYVDGWAGVVAADNSVLDGIREVASLLAAGRLRIHESCHGLLDELAGYSWDPKAALRGEDRPLKIADHGADALRYAIRELRSVWRHWITLPALEEAA